MTSAMLLPRSILALCSPNTQRTASPMLLLPLPLGPTMPVTFCGKTISVRLAKDLNPYISSLVRRIMLLPDRL